MINLSTQNWIIDNIDTILFDKDGTLIDLHFFWGKMTELRVEAILKNYSLPQSYFDILCNSLGYNTKTEKMYPDGITALYSRVKIIEIFKSDLEKLGIKTSTEDLTRIFDEVSNIFYKDLPSYTKPIKEAINFAKIIKDLGLKTGIVTSDSVESTFLTLNHFGWNDLFDVVIGRESSPSTKESGKPTKLALKMLNSKPNKTIMIGDAPMDSISANNAGLRATILVATGQIQEEVLIKSCPFITKSLKEIKIKSV